MGDDLKPGKLYFKVIMPWYKKLWYFITFRKNKIPKYQELKAITNIKFESEEN